MKIAQVAARLRSEMKKLKIDPRGRVNCRSTDYTSEIEVDLRFVYDHALDEIEQVIDDLSQDDFSWNCYS